MGRVVTNFEAISFAREASLGVLPGAPQWYEVEPNSINKFGNTIGTTARSPISKVRARRKGVVTDLDSGVEFEADLTLTHLRDFVECFCFARAIGPDSFLTSAVAAGGFTVPAVSAGASGRLIYSGGGAKSLIYSRGFATPANNGLKVLAAAVAPGAVSITAAGLVNEAPAATDLVEVAIAGIRAAAGDLAVDAQGNITSVALDFTTLGLSVGQSIHVGGVDVLNRFATAANFGLARLLVIAAHKLTLEKRDNAFVAEAAPAGSVDLLFGQFVRNVPVDHADFLQPSTQFELSSPNLMAGGATGYEYALGNWCDSLSIALPLSGKATMTVGFVGTNTTDPATSRALAAANAKVGGQTEAFGTSSDIARLRVQEVDETGLSTDFKSATFTLSNNVAGEKVLGVLGPKYLNAGNIECDLESQMLFTDPAVITAIRYNRTTGIDFALENGDGGVLFDMPTGVLTGGNRDYPANQSVAVNTTFQAFESPGSGGFSLGVSFFPVLP